MFEEHSPSRVPILDIVDSAGVPVNKDGRGTSLALRFSIRSLLSVKPKDRVHNEYVSLPSPCGIFGIGLFPRGWNRTLQWPKVQKVLLEMHTYCIVFPGGVVWRPWAVPWINPDMRLDDTLNVLVWFPPNAKTGPAIDLGTLDSLALRSSARYRAYLATHSLAWKPGVTRIPVPGSRNRIHCWTRDTERYPVITQQDRRALAFGPNVNKHYTRSECDAAFDDLPGLVNVDKKAVDPKTGAVGWRIVPEAAIAEEED